MHNCNSSSRFLFAYVISRILRQNSTTQSIAMDVHLHFTDISSGVKETFEFQTETRRLLDIVAKSLYSDKDACRLFSFT